MIQLYDQLTLDGLRRTADGYLTATVKVARTGIQLYTGPQADPKRTNGLHDKAIVRVYRPESEVFEQDAINSYAYRPITLDHPKEAVTSKNWKSVSIGQTGGGVMRDGQYVVVPIVLMDEAAITAVEAGKRQLSMGYSTVLKVEDGVTPEGEPYDAIQTQLKMNHLAVVDAARGGSALKIGDEQQKDTRVMTTRTIIVDGLPVDVTDKDAAIITRALDAATKAVAAAEKVLVDTVDTHTKAIAAKDAEIAKRDAQIDELKSKVLDAAALDARVAARSALITKANKIAPTVKTDGVSDAEIKKAVVAAAGVALDGKSEAYIDARFDMLTDGITADPVRSVIGNATINVGDAKAKADDAFKRNVEDMNAWRNPKKKEA